MLTLEICELSSNCLQSVIKCVVNKNLIFLDFEICVKYDFALLIAS